MHTTLRWGCAALLVLGAFAARAELPAEESRSATLPAPGPHWIWVTEFGFDYGRVSLIDADAGKMLGMISTGPMPTGIAIATDRKSIYSPETYLSRATRGTRTDVVTRYDLTSLSPSAEVEIPAKRMSGVPETAAQALLDDGRFLAIYNFTPGQSVTIVDVTAMKTIGEINTGGCALVYPSGPRRFETVCGDGKLLTVELDDSGKEKARALSAAFFDPVKDPVTEKAARLGDTWYFTSYTGQVHAYRPVPGGVAIETPWPLGAPGDSAWRPGGQQSLAAHQATKRLYVVVHQGGAGTHKDPGTEVWVLDPAKKARVQRIALKQPAGSITVTQDAKPVMVASYFEPAAVSVYDATSGAFLRSIEKLAGPPILVQAH
jgi:methylamine dehydrogenase heavy chain